MSKTELQKAARQSPSSLPLGCELTLDADHDVVVYRVSSKKWYVRFDIPIAEKLRQQANEDYSRRNNISMVMPKRPTAVVTRHNALTKPGYLPPLREFQALCGGDVLWFDALAPALEAAREWLVVADAAKRLRGG